MDSVQASRVDGNPQRWGGQNSPQGDKQRRQAHKLQLLYAALKAGELEQARQAFVALVSGRLNSCICSSCTRDKLM